MCTLYLQPSLSPCPSPDPICQGQAIHTLLSAMASSLLAKVEGLHVEYFHRGFTTPKEFAEALTRAFQQMHKLDFLHLFQTSSTLYFIFEGLGVEGKRLIKSLDLGIMRERQMGAPLWPALAEKPELPDSYQASLLQGFTSLEHFRDNSLFRESYHVIKNANFPQLGKVMILHHLTDNDLNKLQHLMFHGSFRQVSMLDLWFSGGNGMTVVEALLPLLPRLKYLAIQDENHTWDAVAVARLVAHAREDKCHLFIPGHTHLCEGTRVISRIVK